MLYVGLDVHPTTSTLCILDDNGKVVKRKEIKGPWPDVVAELKRLSEPFSLCFEASCGYGWVYDRVHPLARHVAVAHPGGLALIFKSKRKNDRIDAGKLAKLLYLDAVPTVHVPSSGVRLWRELIEYRRRVVDRQTQVKNEIRALLRANAMKAPPGLWSKKGIQWLKEQPPSELDSLRRDLMCEELEHTRVQLKTVERKLEELGGKHPGVKLLETIPGVGERTAEAFVAYIDDVHRFRRNSQVGTYLGLVPCQDASAGKSRLGHITREGPATVRGLLCEAAWVGIGRSERLRRFFERVKQGDGDRKKIAIVATAHYLSRVMTAMLRNGEAWRELPEEKAGRAESGKAPAQANAGGEPAQAKVARRRRSRPSESGQEAVDTGGSYDI